MATGAARCLLWCLLLAGGFAYVAGVLCGRSDPFRSGNGGYAEIATILAAAPLFYYLGAPRPRPVPCTDRSEWAGAARDTATYVFAFFVGLHAEYAGRLTGVRFSLTARDLGALDAADATALAAGALLVAALLAYHLVLARREGALLGYASFLVGLPLAFAVVTWILRRSYYVHIHHYVVGALLAPFLRYPTPVSRLTQALLLGIAVEGASRWGMDPIWYPR